MPEKEKFGSYTKDMTGPRPEDEVLSDEDDDNEAAPETGARPESPPFDDVSQRISRSPCTEPFYSSVWTPYRSSRRLPRISHRLRLLQHARPFRRMAPAIHLRRRDRPRPVRCPRSSKRRRRRRRRLHRPSRPLRRKHQCRRTPTSGRCPP
jgi:hypothetical protein